MPKKYVYWVYGHEGVYYDGKENRWGKQKIYFYYYRDAKRFVGQRNVKIHRVLFKNVPKDVYINGYGEKRWWQK